MTSDYSYETLACTALRRLPTERRASAKPGPGPQQRRWRRLPGLLRHTGLVLLPLIMLSITVDFVREPAWPWAFAAIAAGVGWVLWRRARAARLLHCAAHAPVLREMHYVTLSDPGRRGAPSLVLFPSDDRTAQPEAVLPLPRPVGSGLASLHRILGRLSPAAYFSGHPAPLGTVQLHGWLGAEPALVPWIEGRVHWPAASVVIGERDAKSLRKVLNRLLAPVPARPTALHTRAERSPHA